MCMNCQVKKPKQPKSAYMFYSGPTIKRLQEEKKVSLAEAAKEAGAIWREMPEAEKASYEKMHDEDVER